MPEANAAMSWLVEELAAAVSAVGFAGLYEALWIVRGSTLELSEEAAWGLARAAVREMVRSGRWALATVNWPQGTRIRSALDIALIADDDAWLEGDCFVALVATGAGRGRPR